MILNFYTSERSPDIHKFGCRTSDISGPDRLSEKAFPINFEGIARYGSYRECLDYAAAYHAPVKAIIAFTDDPGDENLFIRELYNILKCPIVGGGAARNGGSAGDGLSVGHGQAGIFLITDPNVEVTTDIKNIHDQIVEPCHLELTDSRTIAKINGQDAVAYLRMQKEAKGFAVTDFEHMTLSTLDHINAHLSLQNGVVKSGRDLDEDMLLRYVDADRAHQSIVDFYQSATEHDVVIGCAGLASLLESRFNCAALGTYLYGEICYNENGSDFGNLMLSKISFTRKQ